MNGIFLVLAVAVLLLFAQVLLSRIKQPLLTCVNVIAALLLLVLVWSFGERDNWLPKIVLTAVAISGLIRTYKEYRKLNANPESKTEKDVKTTG